MRFSVHAMFITIENVRSDVERRNYEVSLVNAVYSIGILLHSFVPVVIDARVEFPVNISRGNFGASVYGSRNIYTPAQRVQGVALS